MQSVIEPGNKALSDSDSEIKSHVYEMMNSLGSTAGEKLAFSSCLRPKTLFC